MLARGTESPQQTLVFTKTAEHKTSLGSVLLVTTPELRDIAACRCVIFLHDYRRRKSSARGRNKYQLYHEESNFVCLCSLYTTSL